MSDQIQSTMNKVRAYWYIDGFVDLIVGAFFVLIALFLYGQQAAPGRLVAVFSLLFPVVVIGGMFASRALIKFLKERYTFPQRGYVEYNQPSRRRTVVAGVVGFAFAVLVMWLLLNDRSGQLEAWLPVVQGLFLAGLLAMIAYQSGGVTRFYGVAALTLLLGVLQKIIWGIHSFGNVFFFGVVGIALLLTGAVTLRRFLQALPARAKAS